MGVLDKFLDIIKLNDEEDYDDDFFDDEYDDEVEEKSVASKLGGLFGAKSSKSESVDDEEEEFEAPSTSKSSRFNNKVTPMRPATSGRRSPVNMEVCVIKPTAVDDGREITETLLSGRTVILNLEGLDLEIAQRIIDFTCGAAFAINGNLQKISNYIFLVTPTNVDISGDLQDLLNTSFNESSMTSRY